jgi:hypothetical protein
MRMERKTRVPFAIMRYLARDRVDVDRLAVLAAQQRAADHGTLEGVPDNKLTGVPNALEWRLGYSNSATLNKESRDKK